MKNVTSANKLVNEMQKLIYTIANNDLDGGDKALKQAVGNVLGALEVFTFANFSNSEQEIIFNCAKIEIDKYENAVGNGGVVTERCG